MMLTLIEPTSPSPVFFGFIQCLETWTSTNIKRNPSERVCYKAIQNHISLGYAVKLKKMHRKKKVNDVIG
jgi:hypothetical protein